MAEWTRFGGMVVTKYGRMVIFSLMVRHGRMLYMVYSILNGEAWQNGSGKAWQNGHGRMVVCS